MTLSIVGILCGLALVATAEEKKSCLNSLIPEIQAMFECPAGVVSITILGDHEKVTEVVRLSISRESLAQDVPARTLLAANVALGVLRYIEVKRGYAVEEFRMVTEDQDGKSICEITIGADRKVSGDCKGAGRP